MLDGAADSMGRTELAMCGRSAMGRSRATKVFDKERRQIPIWESTERGGRNSGVGKGIAGSDLWGVGSVLVAGCSELVR